MNYYQKLLSPAQYRVFREVLQGKSNREISEELFVTEKTVKFHLTGIYSKCEVRSRAELVSKVLYKDMNPFLGEIERVLPSVKPE